MKAPHTLGFCDIHCHILPGLDDGPEHLGQSIEMCRQAAADGIRTIVATPHFNGVYHPEPETVQRAASELRAAIAQEGLPLDIVLGADVAAGTCFDNLLTERPYLTIGGQGKYILLEPPPDTMPDWMNDIVFELRVSGLGVIITHPERNLDVQREPGRILPLVQSGVMVQITADSVVGNLGRAAKKCASALLKMNAVHFIATDAHSPEFRFPHLRDAAKKASRYLGDKAFELVCDNPRTIVAGNMIETPAFEPSGSWAGSSSRNR